MGNSSKKEKAASRITEQDKAVLQLKQMRDKLRQYQDRINEQLEREKVLAKELVKKGNVERAKLLLKKKKFLEKNLANSDGQLDNLDQMIHSIEFAQIESKVVAGLRSGTDALNKLNAMMKLDDVEKLMDDTRDAIEYQQQINELLSGQLTDENMDEINEELESILKTSLPEVPEHKLPTPEKVPTKEKEKTAAKEKKVLVEAD